MITAADQSDHCSATIGASVASKVASGVKNSCAPFLLTLRPTSFSSSFFGSEARKPLRIALLNHLIELNGESAILDVEHLSGEQHVEIAELKLSIVDVKCTDTTGRRFVDEMQVLKVEGFEKRVVYNASKAYATQLRNAEAYPALCDVVGVTICNFNLWTDKDAQGHFKVPMLSRWRMQEQHSREQGLPQVQYVFLELPKYASGDVPTGFMDKWALLLPRGQELECRSDCVVGCSVS
jgi:predicted transposase/invertase (TIGR01784 family)